MGIKVQVPVGRLEFAGPYIVGRNGRFEITALRIHQWAEADSGDACGTVDIHGIGKRAEPIVGGFRCIRSENIDALCKAWIEARGGLAILPGDDEVTALVTMCDGIPSPIASSSVATKTRSRSLAKSILAMTGATSGNTTWRASSCCPPRTTALTSNQHERPKADVGLRGLAPLLRHTSPSGSAEGGL